MPAGGAVCTTIVLRGHPPGRANPRDTLRGAMDKTSFLDDLQQKLQALLADTPAEDLRRNLKALLTQQFARLELVTREEFDTQSKVLARTRAKLEALEERVAEMEAKR